MKTFTENELRTFWLAVKNGMNKKQTMELFDAIEAECLTMYNEAQKKYGKGPRKIEEEIPVVHKRVVDKPKIPAYQPDKPRQEIKRATASYDNKSSEERISELLETEV